MASAIVWLRQFRFFQPGLHKRWFPKEWWDSSGLKRIFYGEGPQTQPFELNRRRIFILPTRHGLFFAGVLFIMLLGAINYNNSLAYMLTFLLVSLFMVSILHTYNNMAGLVFDAGQCQPVFAGQRAGFEVHINHSGDDVRYAINLVASKQSPVIVDIASHQTSTVVIELPAIKRGHLELGRFTVHTRYPLGIFRAWSYVDLGMQCLVYPRPAARGMLPIKSPRRLSNEGDQGRGADDFVGFRSYHPGDSLRHVYWKAVAREQGMLTKQFGGDRVEEIWLDWETLGHIDIESRLSQLCRWVLDAEEQFLRYGLSIPGKTISPDHGDVHRRQCLQALALFDIKQIGTEQ